MVKKQMSLAAINNRAIPQGWIIANSSAGKPEIQRIDDPDGWLPMRINRTFSGDTQAIIFIKSQAKKGDALAIATIKYLIKHKSADVSWFNMRDALPKTGTWA